MAWWTDAKSIFRFKCNDEDDGKKILAIGLKWTNFLIVLDRVCVTFFLKLNIK